MVLSLDRPRKIEMLRCAQRANGAVHEGRPSTSEWFDSPVNTVTFEVGRKLGRATALSRTDFWPTEPIPGDEQELTRRIQGALPTIPIRTVRPPYRQSNSV